MSYFTTARDRVMGLRVKLSCAITYWPFRSGHYGGQAAFPFVFFLIRVYTEVGVQGSDGDDLRRTHVKIQGHLQFPRWCLREPC